jgi:hypothetical protein
MSVTVYYTHANESSEGAVLLLMLWLKLEIGGFVIPERFLSYVALYKAAPVSFGGVLVGDEGLRVREKLERLAGGKAISYEAVDKNGVHAEGFCDLRNLEFDCSTEAIMFSGELVRPFEQDIYWGASEQLARHSSLSEDKSSSLWLGG